MDKDCTASRLSPGTDNVDLADEVHTARNPAAEPVVVIATLLGAPVEGGLTLPVGADEAAALDERCDLDTPVATVACAHAASPGRIPLPSALSSTGASACAMASRRASP